MVGKNTSAFNWESGAIYYVPVYFQLSNTQDDTDCQLFTFQRLSVMR